jgi:hypothetical protein
MKFEPWGYHLMANLKGCNDNVKDEEAILAFNTDVVAAAEMIAHGEPVVTYFGELGEKNGYTLQQLITTSSLTVHFCDDGKVFFDLFSCKKFNEDAVLGCLHYYFHPTDLDYDVIERAI